jgi:hypothetical protein
MRKPLPRILLFLLVLFLGLQVIRPEMTNPASDPKLFIGSAAAAAPDSRVMATLERSCFDCHSNQSRWPWYTRIAPLSWTVAHDVEEGREHLNFSTWGSYSAEEKQDLLEELCEEVEKGHMPPGNYLLVHGEADLSEADKEILCRWASEERARVGGGASPSTEEEEKQDKDDR